MNMAQKAWAKRQAYLAGARDARLQKNRDLNFGVRSDAEFGVDLQSAYNTGWFAEIELFWDKAFNERKRFVV